MSKWPPTSRWETDMTFTALRLWPLALLLTLALAAPAHADDAGAEAYQFFMTDAKVPSSAKVVSATKSKVDANEAPASIQVLTADDLARYGYRNVAEALHGLTGLFVENTQTYENLGVRGLNILGDYSSRVLVLVDGNATNDPIWGAGSVGNELAVDITDVKRIEVVMGPGSAIYGTHAMFAVVNVITKKGADVHGGALEGGYGSYDSRSGRFQVGGRSGDMDVYLSGALLSSLGHDLAFDDPAVAGVNGGVFAGAGAESAGHALVKLAWKGLSLQASYAKRLKGLATTAYGTDFNVPGTDQGDGNWMSEAKWVQPLGDDVELLLRAYVRDTSFNGNYLFYGSGGGDNKEFSDATWGGGELQLNWQTSPSNHLTVGGEAMNAWRLLMQSWDDVSGSILDETHSMAVGSAYAQDLYKPLDGLTLVGGLRYDRYNTFGDAWSPRAGMLVDLPADCTAKLLWGTAFNAPSAAELFWTDLVTEVGNPALAPERLSTWELVLESAVTRHVKLSVAGYYNNVYDLVQLVSDPALPVPTFRNQGQVRTVGGDINLKADIENVKGHLGFSYQQTTDVATGLVVPNSAADSANAGLSWPFLANRLYLSGEAVYTGLRQTYHGYWVSPNIRSDVTLYSSGLIPAVDLTFKVRNLFDCSYLEPISEEPALVEAVPQDRRSYEARASLQF